MPIPPRTKLLFIGDSITDVGRDRAVNGEGKQEAYGNGYVLLIKSILDAQHPELMTRVVNQGISGNKITDLQRRWQTDVLDRKPGWLSVMIGINDVWRQLDSPTRPEVHVKPDHYEKTYRALLDQTRPQLDGLVLCTPYYIIEPDANEPMRKMMDRYSQIVRTLAKDYDAVLVDTQAAFDRYVQHRHALSLAPDRIHPNLSGHMIIARAWLDAVGISA